MRMITRRVPTKRVSTMALGAIGAGVLVTVFVSILALTASSAQAQSTTTGYPFCLFTGPDQVCAYNSMAQCMAARRGNADFCMPNNRYGGGPYL